MAACCLAAPAGAKEQRPFERGWYGGVGIAHHNFELTADDLNSSGWVIDNPAETSVDDKSMGYSIYAGFRIMRYLAVDLSYIDLGTMKFHVGSRASFRQQTGPSCTPTTCPAPTQFGPSDFTYSASIIRIAAKGSFPIGERWTVNGRFGVGEEQWYVEDGVGGRRFEVDSVGVLGLGVSYLLTPQLRLNFDWERYEPFSVGSAASSETTDAASNSLYEAPLAKSMTLSVEYRL
jgi:hypothetical protein